MRPRDTTQGSQAPACRVQGPLVLKIWKYTGFETADPYNVTSVGTTAEGQLDPGYLWNASNVGLRGMLILSVAQVTLVPHGATLLGPPNLPASFCNVSAHQPAQSFTPCG